MKVPGPDRHVMVDMHDDGRFTTMAVGLGADGMVEVTMTADVDGGSVELTWRLTREQAVEMATRLARGGRLFPDAAGWLP